MTKQMAGYGYYRWSSDRQTDGDSKQRQTERITDFAKRHEIELLGMFGDEAVSAKDGKNLERQFAKLLKALKPGQCIIVENLDRISRQDAIDTLHFLKHEVILGHDLTIFTYSDGKQYSKDTIGNFGDKVTMFFQSELAHQENKKRIERVRSFFTNAIAQIKQGIPVAIGSKLPSWITVKEGKWDFNNDKKKIVQRIFREYLAGTGMRTIAVRLNRENTPPLRAIKKKTIWSVSTISCLLRSDNVLGTLHFRDETIKNAFPAIVSEDDFLSVQVKLQHHKNRRGKVTDEYRVSNLFRGLTRCSHCKGNVMVEKCVGHKDRNERPYHYFACFSGRQGKCVAKKRINADTVEKAFFVDCLAAAPSDLLTEDNKEALSAEANIEEKIAGVQRNIANYLKLMESGMDFNQVQSRLLELREQKHKHDEELAEAKKRTNNVSRLPEIVQDFTTLLRQDLTKDETRRKIVNMMPYIVKEIVFSLKPDEHPDFTVVFVNGETWSYTQSIVEESRDAITNKVTSREHQPSKFVLNAA